MWLQDGVAKLFGISQMSFFVTFGFIFLFVILSNRILWAWVARRNFSLLAKIGINLAALFCYILVLTLLMASAGHLLG